MGTNTGLGIGIGIPFKNNALGGDKPYFPPELKARMIGVWTNYGKKNTDADRNIIKNKIPNAGGDLEILNAAYKLNSGFGEYNEDFTTWTKSSKITSVNSESFSFSSNVNWVLLYYKSNIGKDIPSFKVRIKLKGEGKVFYNYITSEGVFTNKVITSEEYVVPTSYNTKYTGETPVNCGFSIGITSEECSGTITQIPNFEDAFVTDGINDMIISQKTLQEMGVTKELTIVSMIHQISFRNSASIPLTNYIRNGDTFIRNSISNIGKTGIYGYTCFNIKNVNSSASKVINNILGDKNDYIVEYRGDILSERFSVQGYIDDNGNILETSSVAHYWTFALLGKATEDDINLIIAYFNLDRTLKPDIRCNIERQGITNDNHADFNDRLIDYSGNGRDIQMYNLAWKGGSGIAAKQYETFKDWTSESSSTSIIKQIDEFTRIVESTTNGYWVSRIRRDSDLDKVYSPINVYLYQDNNFLVHECKYEVDGVKYAIPINEPVGKGYHKLEMYTKDRYTELPENAENVVLSEWYFPKSTKGSIKYSIIPSCKGGILLDGINDFGKVIDMPIYKDYTFIIDREIISIGNTAGIVASKSEDSTDVNKQGAFLFEYLGSPNNVSAWSFYKNNGKVANTDFTRSISYQSKYSYNGIELLAGTALDSDKLWLGILRDRDSRFANVAIYSLMSFPYSMSKFLIERQLKKHKLGTLYPNMVEFRPIIKQDDRIKNVKYYKLNETADYIDLNIGDYIPVGQRIAIVVDLEEPYKITSITSSSLTDVEIRKAGGQNYAYDILGYVTDKSPQKITMDIQVDSSLVQWNPVITSNVEYVRLDFYLNNYQKRINIGDYISKDAYLRANLYLKNNVDELTVFTFNGVNIGYRRSSVDDTAFNINQIYNYDSPQEVNITIDEYIRYEDIVQPYPVLLRFKDENGNEVSWGGKFRVGSTITRIGSAADSNLLPNIYNIFGLLLNGNQVTSSKVIVEKTMVFKAESAYIFDNNEPKCILSPRLLRIPNSSYKILGYIPDISGHGNNGVIHNSAYAEGSGVNEDGSYQFDGVDDFVTIPTLSSGGKQVLMKVNWQKSPALLYDQRASGSFAVLTTLEDDAVNPRIAYQARNQNGKTYIDGIENNNIETYTLKDITHNITIANSSLGGIIVPVIGCNTGKSSNFAKMSLYDFMLFDEISTDDKIQELNEYVGVEAKVELPPYYWDAYGKTNSDADKDTIQQRGVAVGDYDLINYNHAYDKMSGYDGYEFSKFDNELDWYLTPDNGYIDVVSRNGYSITLKNLSTSDYGWYFQNATVKEFITKDIPFKVKANKSIRVYWDMHSYKSNGENFGYVVNNITLNPNEDTSINLRHLTEEELTELDANKDRMYYLLRFDLSTLAVDEEVTIEMLPLYPNGLAYDGAEDYSENVNIPIVDDFTFLVKASLLKGFTGNGGLIARKGDVKHVTSGGYAFVYCLDSSSNEANRNSYYSFGKALLPSTGAIDPPLIGYMTKTSVNGVATTFGTNPDIKGINFGDWNGGRMSMVVYKSMLYPKTIPLLQINFLKNLMEKDEIIDLNNPIFIKDE
jgi:hypothetical protein